MRKIMLALALISSLALADGTDNPDPLAVPDNLEVEIWVPFNGTHLLELQPDHKGVMPFAWVPRKGMMVKPEGPAYWVYFDRFPCRGEYAKVFDGMENNPCYEDSETLPNRPVDVPEPKITMMLVISLVCAWIIKKLNFKK